MAKNRHTRNKRQRRPRRRTMKGGLSDIPSVNLLNLDIPAIPHADDAHELDMSGNDLNLSDDTLSQNNSSMSLGPMDPNELNINESSISLGPMDPNELNTSNISVNTTLPDESFGGKRRRRALKKRRGRKTRKYRGGMRFGNGVGANSNDPNYSIFNTNMLKLFPYKAN